ncbi:oxidoreductase [Actinomycetes bacterium]|nr:oxidoreductase [Actinomycetes bacterium]
MTLQTRKIADLNVSLVGLGCMPLSNIKMVDHREQAIATIHHAIDSGITLLDTANVYSPTWDTFGHNETLVAEAVRTYSGSADISKVVIATKGGIIKPAENVIERDGTREGLLKACEASLKRLNTSSIELYQFHRHDPSVTYTEQMLSLKALKDAGMVKRIGLSNAQGPELAVALKILGGPKDGGVVSIQNEYSPRYRGEQDVLDKCTELGIAFLPWSPLGGAAQAGEVGSRYSDFAAVATEVGASAQEVVLAWLLALTPVMIPIPGATKTATVDSIIRSAALKLTSAQVYRLTAADSPNESLFPDAKPRSPLR